MRPLLLTALITLAAAASTATAQIYRWVDQGGVVNYTNVPPAAGVQVTRLDRREARASPVPDSSYRPLLPALPSPAPSTPPGDVDRATLEMLGRTLAARNRAPAPPVAPHSPAQLSELLAP